VAAILFDEPLTVIDPHLKWQLRCKLKEIHEQLGLTLIYVTHDQVEAMTFADQIVVMYEGELVQIGPPDELFENPNHKFVGYFIGSPGMNFLPCTVEGDMAKVYSKSIRLDAATAARARKATGKLELGIRPMYLEVLSEPVDDTIAVDVIAVQDQGSFKIITVALNGHTLNAKLSEGKRVPEGKAWLRFPARATKLFEDERLLRVEE
jgi:glycerol transport system ATP-binding protein